MTPVEADVTSSAVAAGLTFLVGLAAVQWYLDIRAWWERRRVREK